MRGRFRPRCFLGCAALWTRLREHGMASPDRSLFQSLADFDVEPAPLVPSGDTRGAANFDLPATSYVPTRGAADVDAERDRLAETRELKQTLDRDRRTRQWHYWTRVLRHARQRAATSHRGPSRARRPGPCRASGSRRSRSTSRSRARSPGSLADDPDPPSRHVAAASRLSRGAP